MIVFAVLGAALLGTLGFIAGLWAEKFDQMAALPELPHHADDLPGGVFYSVHSLPAFWQTVSHFNPFFYMIDGFRRGFFGISDVSPWLSLLIVGVALAVACAVADTSAGRGLQDPSLMKTSSKARAASAVSKPKSSGARARFIQVR